MAFKYNIIKAFEDERAEGKAEGEASGELRKVISQIRKKVSRDMSAKDIADMLEEDMDLVVRICDTLKKHPDWDDEKIRELL